MRRFLKRIRRLITYLFYWCLDYLYVTFWQVAGFLHQGDAAALLHSPRSHKKPIIIIPGIYERWSFMKPIAEDLYNAGYDVHVLEGIGYNREDVETIAEVVCDYTRKNKLQESIIVAHSKGGLVGKYLLAYKNDDRLFSAMVAINTPFNGSVYAKLFPITSLRIFVPNSPLLSLLKENIEVNKRIVSIYGQFDPHIPGGSFLNGAVNVKLPIYGHFRIINSKRLRREVVHMVTRRF